MSRQTKLLGVMFIFQLISCSANASDPAINVDSSNFVGINANVPLSQLHVSSGTTTIVTSGSDTIPNVTVEGPTQGFSTSNNPVQLGILSSSTLAANAGGTLGLGGKFNSNSYAVFGIIKAGKDNATSGQNGGYLALGARANGSNVNEMLRVTSSSVGIGTTTPTSALQVGGTVTATAFSGSVPVSSLNSGTGATSGTYWRGDGTWATPASTPGWTILNTLNIFPTSATAAAFDSTYINSTYNKYAVEFDSVVPVTDQADLLIEVSTNNGSSWITSSYLNSNQGTASSVTSSVWLSKDSSSTGWTNSGAYAGSGTVKFSKPAGSQAQVFSYNIGYFHGAGTNFLNTVGSGAYVTTGTINAMRFRFSSGNIIGNFHLYGIPGT